MENTLKIYNSLTREKESFTPLTEGYVGMYVCGPTVYSDVHLGNCRTFTSFDVIYRYLMYLGYKVRYVRNITDVGHLEGDADTNAEDKISKKARLEALEPMEIAQKYANGFHDMMRVFNTLPPSIEPRATGHIPEQIKMVQDILDNGFAYVANGSVYFDTLKFIEETKAYGQLSGRKVEDLLSESRDNLKNQGEKRHPADFAIWMKAAPEHLMRWSSPWSEGFPGWHLECSAMSTKYLGETFDIHGGGNDLKFPHHENEIAQNMGSCNCSGARYWMHTNMLLMNGRKMSKSDGNTITPTQLFTGDSPHVSKGYSPMVVKFFMLQSHYRSTLDLTDEALQAAEKGYKRLMEGNKLLQQMAHPGNGSPAALDEEVKALIAQVHAEMNDDFNTPKALAVLFEAVTKINSLNAGHLSLNDLAPATLAQLKETFSHFIYDVFALTDEEGAGEGAGPIDSLMDLIIDIRQEARANKDWGTSDKIRDALQAAGIVLKDSKEGTSWAKA
ncbi:cysteine--tRNA ligase [Phaeodactylibacter luteus]|uniref:Cysteine--tRNA ligase n=1 Tax=Phaeodactylibacter luteus TaxID=1564516 RepID=A0A5C6RIV1_9BACT|nr:cysteine--tRNA ligase [Phaeodactylibacter luteus]TXB61855.1 cysteine--tRNA ligase [Phaeodactylibacter luteus]